MENEELVNDDIQDRLYEFSDYIILSKLGRGSYGRVYLAKNKINKCLYAIKKLKIDQGVQTSTLREIALLKILQHPNIVTFHQVLLSGDKLYMVLEYLKMSLDLFIKDQDISPDLLQSFMFQLLQGTLFCHHRRILHRDIKPQNILVHNDLKIVKLSDFGLARQIPISPPKLTPTVVTLYYRSPELITNNGYYTSGIDIWALGCVFVEIMLKTPCFQVKEEMNLYYSWFTQLGMPKEEDMPGVIEKFDLLKISTNKIPDNALAIFRNMVSENCYDLILKMFIYKPSKRINAGEALHHEFFKDFDKSVVPAINEEKMGILYNPVIVSEEQVLYLTPENFVAKMSEFQDQDILDNPTVE